MNKNLTGDVAGPSSKRPRIENLNDSFYDSEEDELVSQACEKVTPKAQFANFTSRTPVSSTSRLQLPMSATTLKGKPLTPATNPVVADDDDITVIHTSKPFFRLAKEVKELSQERDTLKGQTLYLEQSLRAKEKESQEHLQKIAELTQKYTEALEEVREVQRRSDEELVHLRTQLQFQTEQTKAGTFKNDQSKAAVKENIIGQLTATPLDAEARPALSVVQDTHVPKIKPRMSTSSVNKSFSSVLKPRFSRCVGQLHAQDAEEDVADAFMHDENANFSKTFEKGVQTNALRVADVITNPDIWAKRDTYDAILNTMICASFIDECGNSDEKDAQKSLNGLAGVDDEKTLDEILKENCNK